MIAGGIFDNLLRDWKRGIRATWYDRFVARRILHWRNPHAEAMPEDIPVYVLTGSDDWLPACWMLASWFHFTGRNWRVFLHDDGQLPPEVRPALVKMFPGIRAVAAGEASRPVLDALAGHQACREYRLAHPMARKIFDIPILTRSARFIILDSDLLFFRKPEVILRWCADGAGQCWFNKDANNSSPVSRSQLREKLGLDVWHGVNAGLCLVDRATIDLDLCERALRETNLAQKHISQVEATLFAICASAVGRGGLLPRAYEVTKERLTSPDAVSRRYAGAVRQRFYAEGIPRVKDALLNEIHP
jgi:hypothetical protein